MVAAGRVARTAARVTGALGAIACLGLAPSCRPDLDQIISIVDKPIVLAVRSDPAEAAPTIAVKYTALYVDGAGPIMNGNLRWDFCEARKPLADLGPVNTECLDTGGSWFVPLGSGADVSGAIPPDACKLFGPDVPPPVPGQPQGRPVDPDATGGYYDPLRIVAPDSPTPITIEETRLTCGAGVIPADTGVEYEHRYHANTNPIVASLSVAGGSTGAKKTAPFVTSDKGTNPVAAGARLTFEVAWSSCPTAADVCGDGFCGPDETATACPADCATPLGCTGAERFVVFDVGSQALVDQRESIAVAWYATAGAFDANRTGRDAADFATLSDNGWTAPAAAGPVHLWVVLRDIRGGIGWAEYVLDVQ